ncbi:trehalose 6-phosphate phosphatase [Motilibacter peucedani]|uniref:Trehalose 6-phosphate phosphatase n=1 Tax=Motilibacter peucedani TaxID=598650 RepID=A0A420XKE8_9ACTN|nr:trehalose-phosphatase [Motilibacter peucedani]RKS68490.1 trehalose 6-phosphate phosphatase [Motilibacter peucedani]
MTEPADPLHAPLRTDEGRAGLAALLAAPGRAVVGLDFDGTLAPIVDDPADARAHPAVRGVLERLAPLLGRLAVVTGRPVEQVVELAGVAQLHRLEVRGHYGLERWDAAAGRVVRPELPPGVEQVRRALPGLLLALAPDAAVEDKGASLAVHTRRTPAPEETFERLQAPLAELAEAHGLVVEPGRFVLELRPPGADKGGALRALADELGDPSAVVFVGDDLGDLAAFEAVRALRAGGTPGVVVCSGSDEVPELLQLADAVVEGPAGVASWLTALADALGTPEHPNGAPVPPA